MVEESGPPGWIDMVLKGRVADDIGPPGLTLVEVVTVTEDIGPPGFVDIGVVEGEAEDMGPPGCTEPDGEETQIRRGTPYKCVEVSVLKTMGAAHLGDGTHPSPYPDELIVFVHDPEVGVLKGRGGPRETMMWSVAVGTPGVVIVTYPLGYIGRSNF